MASSPSARSRRSPTRASTTSAASSSSSARPGRRSGSLAERAGRAAAGTDQIDYDVEVDAEGNALLTGLASGTTVFDAASPATSARLAAGAADAFVAKYDPDGALIWAKLLGDASPQVGTSIAKGPLGTVWATGYFTGSITVDAAPPVILTSAGGIDVFLARLSP